MKYLQFKEIYILILLSLILFFSSINSLPVLDRDEARYVQASKQMIESNNYSSIKFQNEYRSKKPIGIYWLQALSLNLLADVKEINSVSNQILGGYIWKYRIISAISAFFSILLLYLLSKPVFGKKESFYGSLILACSLLFIAESHIAKTDSILVTLTILVMLTLLKYFLNHKSSKSISNFLFLWGGLGIAVLIKGPILPIIFILAVVFIFIIKKDIKWFYASKPFWGLILMLGIALPWFLSISGEEQKNFFTESIIHDFFGKVLGAQENHGAIPGFHFLGLWFFFFPFAVFLIPAFYYLRLNLKENKYIFIIVWLVPTFFIMELIPTKLPHYVLPLYPAISIIMGLVIANFKINKNIFTSKIALLGYIFHFFTSNGLIFFLYKAIENFGNLNNLILFSLLSIVILNNLTFIFLIKKNIKACFFSLILLANLFTSIVYFLILPSLEKIWVTQNIAHTINNQKGNNNKRIAVLGYNEPSLIFELGTDTKIYKNVQPLVEDYSLYNYLLIEKKYFNKFNETVNIKKLSYNLIKIIKGFNASKGVLVEVYILKNN